jgi:hypothetical protein
MPIIFIIINDNWTVDIIKLIDEMDCKNQTEIWSAVDRSGSSEGDGLFLSRDLPADHRSCPPLHILNAP